LKNKQIHTYTLYILLVILLSGIAIADVCNQDDPDYNEANAKTKSKHKIKGLAD